MDKESLRKILEKTIIEGNAVGGGQIVGSQNPIGMKTNPNHKLMWKGQDPNKDLKTDSEINEEHKDLKNIKHDASGGFGAMEPVDVEVPRMIRLLWTPEERQKDLKTSSHINESVSIEDLKIATELLKETDAKNLRSWASQVGLKKIGFGSTRTVYEFGNDYVLKLAKDSESTDSNVFEAKTYNCLGYDYAAEVTESDPSGWWLIMEKVKKIDYFKFEEKLEELLNLSSFEKAVWHETLGKEFADIITNNKDTEKFYNQSEWFRGLYDRVKNCKVWPLDFGYGNFGIRQKTNQLVLLDFGFENF